MPIQYRYLQVQEQTEEQKQARKMSFSVSSEYPVERWFGTEILDHSADSIDLSDFNDGAPVLFDHDTSKIVGVIEGTYLSDRKLGIDMRFGNTAIADELYQNCSDGIVKKVSIGYIPRKMKLDDPKNEVYRVIDWKPIETSFVAIPADPTVGIGRSQSETEYTVEIINDNIDEEIVENLEPDNQIRGIEVAKENIEQSIDDAKEILAMGEKCGDLGLAHELIRSNTPLPEARNKFLEKLSGVAAKPLADSIGEMSIGLSPKEQKRYSLLKIARSAIRDTGNPVDISFEREVSNAIAQRTGMEPRGFFIPMGDLSFDSKNMAREQAVGTPSFGGNLVQTDLYEQNLVRFLVNNTAVLQLNPTQFTGLTGNFDIPRETNEVGANWVGEGGEGDQSTATTDLITFSPKQITSRTSLTRLMMQQGSLSVENWLRAKMISKLGLAIDIAAINGTGSQFQPLGVLSESGVSTLSLGTNGGAITFDNLINAEQKLVDNNALFGNLGYITTPSVFGVLRKIKSTTGAYLWQGADNPLYTAVRGSFSGIPVAQTKQMPSNLAKGSGTNLHSLVLGNWQDFAIALWGVLDVLPNPYGTAYASGGVELRAFQSIDMHVLQPKSFFKYTDIVVS